VLQAGEPGNRLQKAAIVVSVTDHGNGIPPEMLDHVFDLFVQGDTSLARQPGGLGIGLTIARQLTELHHGRITATSAGPDRGATFEVSLPKLSAADVRPPPAARPERKRTGRARRVLVVDDNLDAAESLRRLLRSHGHVVEQAHNAEEALALATHLKPEIAVLDIGLPKMDGCELARRLKAQGGHGLPLLLVALSGYGQESDFNRSREAGFDAHLVKPVDPEPLLDLIERAPEAK
jgi:CheY-like chemotaxis protein